MNDGLSSISAEESAVQNVADELQEKLSNYEKKDRLHSEEIHILRKELSEFRNKFSLQEAENESLRRIIERSNVENDKLLQKLDLVSSSARAHEENVSILKAELKSLQEQNGNLRSSFNEMNLARDEVVDKLKQVSIETRELIENCEKASEETKIFKSKIEILEEELSNTTSINESLLRENEYLRQQIQHHLVELNVPSSVDTNYDTESCVEQLSNATSHLINIVEESKKSNRTLKELERDIQQNNENLLVQLEKKDDIIAKQSVDFLNIKNRVDEYHAEIVRLDQELKDCRSRVFSLNENLESINAENLDLAEYTKFKNWHKKFAGEENIDKLLSKLEMLHEIEDLFDNELAPRVNNLVQESSNDGSDTNVDVDANALNKIKNHFERALYAIEKLNEENIRLATEYESYIQTKNEEIVRLKEILSHTSLYNEILEQTLKQCRENAKIDRFVEEKTDELITANKALLDNFEELRKIYCVSHSYNGLLFAKYHQLNLCYKILKINLGKILPIDSSRSVNEEIVPSPSVANNLNNVTFLMNELLQEILAYNVDFDQRTNEAKKIFNNYEVSLATKDYLKNTVDDMTQEVKQLTCRVEQEMAEKIREIESLRNEIDSTKTDNRELVNKIKNCNREIISLSTENYDLNEKLALLPEMEKSFQHLNNELTRVHNASRVEKIKQIHQQCHNLKENHANLRNEICSLSENGISTIFQLVDSLHSRMPSSGAVEPTNLLLLLDRCAEFKQQNQLLKEAVHTSKEQVLREICLIKKAFDLSNISNCRMIDCKSNVNNLHTICEQLKQQNKDTKHVDCLKSISEILEVADSTITAKLQRLSDDFQTVQNDLNFALADKEECKRLISSYSVTILKIVQDLKALCELFSTFAKEIPKECSHWNAVLLKTIQEATSHTLHNMKLSFTHSNEEIIKEMQEMNLELKKRGETISNLNQTVDEVAREKRSLSDLLAQHESVSNILKTELGERGTAIIEKDSRIEQLSLELTDLKSQFDLEIQKKDSELSKLSATLENVLTELRSKEETIAALENEISKSKDVQDGDVSSMGNISRTEEVSRLHDVEDSFEERYMKLRCIAIKMKKNIAELNQQLKNEKTERAVIQSKLNAALGQAKRTQALQEECDRITDELDIRTKENKELKKIIAEADKQIYEIKCQCDSLTEKIKFLSKADENTKGENQDMVVDMKNLKSQLENLKEEKYVQETLKNEKHKEVQSLKQKLKENEDYNKKLLNDLEQSKLEARKQGALTLEMRDYEKTISDLTDKLKKKQNVNEELTEKLKLGTESNVSFVERIKQLEEQIASYVASNKMADEQILQLNKIISTYEKNLEAKDIFVKRLTQQLEEEKSKIEKLTIQLADSIGKFDTLKESNKIKEDLLNNQLKSSQNKITALEETVKKKEIEFDKLKEDFESYKIRAHNVLQKLKSPNNFKNNEEKLKTEIDNLSQTVNELRKRLDDKLNELEKQKTEIKLVETAKEKLQLRIKEMNEAYAEKIKEQDNTRIEFKSYKLNSETLIACYKNEIEQLQNICEKYKADLEELKIANEVANNVAKSKEDAAVKALEEEMESSSHDEKSEYYRNEKRKESKSRNESENSARERNQNHSLISLEKLLERDDVEENRGDETELKKNMKLLENQVTYLNGILNESEKNAARNEQQVMLLKDEIRRLQKIIERAPHLQNGEYLKNVLLNFFTFPDGEEKCRLITILETLLQLTSEETETLSSIAKGYRVEPKRTSGLSSMLKLW